MIYVFMIWNFTGFFTLMFLISRGTFDGKISCCKRFIIYTICGPVGWGIMVVTVFNKVFGWIMRKDTL